MKTTPRQMFVVALLAALSSWAASVGADEPIHIMPLGDSITAGYTDNSAWNVPFWGSFQ